MVITELYIKNFGKFSERHFYFRDGMQVIQGENEFGKTTLHAFIRAMLFGMERGRGRAAAKDTFSRYEPWDNPGYYGGMMRFACGGKSFRLERSFSRFAKGASLICEDDGEELSVGDGDLSILLGGISEDLFDSTVSVGQMKAEPGQELFHTLENYTSGYFETGGGEYDLNAARKALRTRKRETMAALEEERAALEAGRERLLQECRFLERDMERLRGEYEEREAELKRLGLTSQRRKDMEREALRENRDDRERRETGKRSRGLLAGGAACAAASGLGFLWSRISGGLSGGLEMFSLTAPVEVIAGIAGAAGLLLLIAGIAVRIAGIAAKTGKYRADNDGKETDDLCQEADTGREQEKTQEAMKRIEWEMRRIRSERKEKELRRDNLKEQYDETEPGDKEVRLKEKIRALTLAEEALEAAGKATAESMEMTVGRRASAIFSEITEGRYRSLASDRTGGITVWDGVRRIPAHQLSRGTVEQIYFSIRMAAAEMLPDEPMPVILDDVFAFYDDKRLECVLKWLSGQKKQVIIFTCHRREEEMINSFL